MVCGSLNRRFFSIRADISWKQQEFDATIGQINFIQDNESQSSFGTLRGLHYQKGAYSQAKLVRVIKGEVLDVAVDLRKSSPTFGKHISVLLSDENKRQLFIPRGFAHGFLVKSDWPIADSQLVMSEKDKQAGAFREAEYFE